MASDVPAYLQVGTPVSAKFKGAFCEATIKSIKKFVKCKVLYKDVSGSAIVGDESIVGDLQLNSHVEVKQDNGDLKEATIQKMNDHSQYTVVFDDGDERTLRRTNVFVMGEKHFQEHENLDNLPLTDPENFLSPVVMHNEKGRRKRKRSQPHLDEEDSDSDGVRSSKRWNESDKQYLGKVVCVEQGERKKSWFPALGLKHFGSHPENQIYVQSFKDGKKLLVKKTDVKEFCKTKEPILGIMKGEIKADPILRMAIDKALSYHDMGELPKGWNILDTIDEKEDSSDEESHGPSVPVLSNAEKSFQDTVYTFLNLQGTPVTKPPMINNQGIVLQKLYNNVIELGGYEEITNPQWRNIYKKMGLRNMHTTTSFNMKNIYKKFLLAYEEQNRSSVKSPSSTKGRTRRSNISKDVSVDNDKSSTISESDSEPDRRRTTRSSRTLLEKSLDPAGKTRRSNLSLTDISLADDVGDKSTCSSKDLDNVNELDIDVVNSPESSVSSEEVEQTPAVDQPTVRDAKYKTGNKISVRYGSGKNLRYYTAKILEVDRDESEQVLYYIHYNGWNRRYNEWIKDERITGLSTDTSTKKQKNIPPPTPITKIAKDPPARYKAKMDSDSLSATSKVSSDGSENANQKPEKPTSIAIFDKPPSPIKSPTSFNPESALYTSEQISTSSKPPQLKTPRFRSNVADSLIIPEIKPSPIKPRMTRNSMQDTFLLNAIEESIGKPNQAAMNLQADILMKSEQVASTSSRRRSHRQPSQQSPKQEISLEQHDDKDDLLALKKEDVKSISTTGDSDVIENPLDVTSIDQLKQSSREDSVKKWIEDSNKLLSTSKPAHDESTKHEGVEKSDEPSDEYILPELNTSNTTGSSNKRGRKPKPKKFEENKKKKLTSEDDDVNSDDDIKEDKIIDDSNNTNNNIANPEKNNENIHSTLSDFCNIIDKVDKLNSGDWSEKTDHAKPDPTSHPTPTKDPEKSKKPKYKRKRSKSFADDEHETKSPRKEKKGSQELKYNVDFMSDLGEILKDKDPVERINIMQERLNSMRELYMKLRTEVASIDRRRRRKQRKQ